jgi:organic hydroperoxide reductase OsmC/OhrA
MSTLYTAAATATGSGRDGHVATDDGLPDLDLATPKEVGHER